MRTPNFWLKTQRGIRRGTVAAALGEQPELLGDVAGERHERRRQPAAASARELVTRCGSWLLGRAIVPPVLGIEVRGLGDVAGERHELRAGYRQRRRRDR